MERRHRGPTPRRIFRIQNPWTQRRAFSTRTASSSRNGFPELRDVPAERLHTPPPAGLGLAKGYPPPVVDHAVERERTLEMFKRHRLATKAARG